jgi:hypothetical protein
MKAEESELRLEDYAEISPDTSGDDNELDIGDYTDINERKPSKLKYILILYIIIMILIIVYAWSNKELLSLK